MSASIGASAQVGRDAGPYPGLLQSFAALAVLPFDPVLAGMVGAGLGIEAICLYLGLSRAELDQCLVRLDLRTPHDRPMRKAGSRGWPAQDVRRLIYWRMTGIHPVSIAERLARSVGGVRSKCRRIGVPAPSRKLLRRVDPSTLEDPPPGFGFPGFQKPTPQPSNGPAQQPAKRSAAKRSRSARGPRAAKNAAQHELTLLRVVPSPVATATNNAPSKATPPVVPVGRKRSRETDREFMMGLSMRYFGGQGYRSIARAMGLSDGAVRSILDRIDLPRDLDRKKFGVIYDPECAQATLDRSGFSLVRENAEEHVPEGERPLFWRAKRDCGIKYPRKTRLRMGKDLDHEPKGARITLVTRAQLDAERRAAAAVTLVAGDQPIVVASRSQSVVPGFRDVVQGASHEKHQRSGLAPAVRPGLPGVARDQMPWAHLGHGSAAGRCAHP